MKTLKLALVHANIRYKDTETNRKTLLDLIREIAQQGADIILTPEMAIAGYSYDSRRAIELFVEEITGPTLTAVRETARIHEVYVCIGLALKNQESGIFTNSVVAVAPDGEIVCRYNKINAESRWAYPGNALDDNTFSTPWGRVGLLICSDTYHGLMPRVTALRGEDLLLVPTNWPPSGLNPKELWRARALENGFYLAACNRTGMDRIMDCRQASSCVCDPSGNILYEGTTEDSRIFPVHLRLTAEGILDNVLRRKRMADRLPQCYHDCYLNMQPIRDLTGFLDLPQPWVLNIHGVVPGKKEHPMDALLNHIPGNTEDSETSLEKISGMARRNNAGIVLCSPNHKGQHIYLFRKTGKFQRWEMPPRNLASDREILRFDFGPARVHLADTDMLFNPEPAVAAANKGCDIVLLFNHEITPEHHFLAGVRSIENIAVAACSLNAAGIWITSGGHQRWDEMAAGPGEVCRYPLDTHRTRLNDFRIASISMCCCVNEI